MKEALEKMQTDIHEISTQSSKTSTSSKAEAESLEGVSRTQIANIVDSAVQRAI